MQFLNLHQPARPGPFSMRVSRTHTTVLGSIPISGWARTVCVCYFHMHTSILPSFLMCAHTGLPVPFVRTLLLRSSSLTFIALSFVYASRSHTNFECVCYLLSAQLESYRFSVKLPRRTICNFFSLFL